MSCCCCDCQALLRTFRAGRGVEMRYDEALSARPTGECSSAKRDHLSHCSNYLPDNKQTNTCLWRQEYKKSTHTHNSGVTTVLHHMSLFRESMNSLARWSEKRKVIFGSVHPAHLCSQDTGPHGFIAGLSARIFPWFLGLLDLQMNAGRSSSDTRQSFQGPLASASPHCCPCPKLHKTEHEWHLPYPSQDLPGIPSCC